VVEQLLYCGSNLGSDLQRETSSTADSPQLLCLENEQKFDVSVTLMIGDPNLDRDNPGAIPLRWRVRPLLRGLGCHLIIREISPSRRLSGFGRNILTITSGFGCYPTVALEECWQYRASIIFKYDALDAEDAPNWHLETPCAIDGEHL
jgi:hypothetical protein